MLINFTRRELQVVLLTFFLSLSTGSFAAHVVFDSAFVPQHLKRPVSGLLN